MSSSNQQFVINPQPTYFMMPMMPYLAFPMIPG